MPKVLNRRTSGVPPGAVYVGRPSEWGNIFKVGPNGTRAEVIQIYSEWVWHSDNGAFRQKAREQLRGKDLVCWCAPKPCHADVLLKLANERGPPMTDTRTLEGLRERLVASTGEHPAVFSAAEVAELVCGLDIAEEMAEELRMAASSFSHREKGFCNHCSYAEALAKWAEWKGS